MGTALGHKHGSCRPVTLSFFFFPDEFMDSCSFEMEEVGLSANLNTIVLPFVIPPRIPPALFVLNLVLPPFLLKIISLTSDPVSYTHLTLPTSG